MYLTTKFISEDFFFCLGVGGGGVKLYTAILVCLEICAFCFELLVGGVVFC